MMRGAGYRLRVPGRGTPPDPRAQRLRWPRGMAPCLFRPLPFPLFLASLSRLMCFPRFPLFPLSLDLSPLHSPF